MESARLSISIFIIIFLLAMFGIGYELGGYCSGAVVMSLAAASPHVLNNARLFLLDFPQTAMTALAFYFLLKTDIFSDRKFSLIFGLVLALSFLTKWSTAFFIFLPILWFLIRICFFPGNRLTTYLSLFIPAGISLGGIIWYYLKLNQASMQPNNFSPPWWVIYLFFILIPGAICVALLLKSEQRQKELGDNEKSGSMRFTNFSLMSVLFAAITAPWYLYAAKRIKEKLFSDIYTFGKLNYPNLFQENMDTIIGFFRTIFNFYPVFLSLPVIGLILIFIFYKNKFFQRFLLPVNIVFATLLMLKVGFPIPRYFLSLLIFTAALGGYWVVHTGKARGIITIAVIGISFSSIFAGTIIPMDYPGYFSIGTFTSRESLPQPCILCSLPGYSTSYKLKQIFEIIAPHDRNSKSKILIIKSRKAPLQEGFSELFMLETYKRNIQINDTLYEDDFMMRCQKEPDNLHFLKDVNHILIISAKDDSIEPVKNEISTHFPGVQFQVMPFEIAEGCRTVVMTPE